MKVGQALLQERCGLIQPKFAKHVDLSHCNLVTLEGLKQCSNLQSLILRYNSISIIPNAISALPELWKLDLSHNLVCSLEGLLKVRCIGTLVLSYNNLSWPELRKIQHMTILDLRLAGNPNLDKDPYYRRHVIDCLPNAWMIDGILVTAAERDQVSRFFKNSEVLERPVRHKLRPVARTKFVPSHIKDLNQRAVLGKNALQLLSRFPQKERQTLRTDYRRITFIAEMYENDVALQRSYWSLMSRSGQVPPESSSPLPAYLHSAVVNNSEGCDFLQSREEDEEDAPLGFGQVPPLLKLLKCRNSEVEKCNMLLLLLAAGLEFSLPLSLIDETLHTANLDNIGGVSCVTLLQLPHEDLLLTASVLLSSVIIDRGEGEEGGLYKRLFVSLYVVLSNLLRTTHGFPDQFQLKFMSPVIHRSLLAAEVVQLMCLVPSFLDMVDRDQGVLDVVAIATQNPHVKDVIQDMVWNATDYDFEEASSALLQLVRGCIENSNYEMLELEPGLVPYQAPLSAVAIHTKRKINQRARSAVAARRKRNQGAERVPQLGDTVNLPRQRKGRIIGLHQDQLALVQISAHPVAPLRDACGDYVYIDMQFMEWDHVNRYWNQQLHVQEFPSDARIRGRVEQCYSVISNRDYSSRYQSPNTGQVESATSEIGEAYYVHENKQLQLDVDQEGAQYISVRSSLPGTPGLAEGVFAEEQQVNIRLTPQREAIPVMKRVLEHATDQNIHKLERELKNRASHLSAMDVAQQLYKPGSDTMTPLPSETLTSQPSEMMPTQPSVTMTMQPQVSLTTNPPPPSAETFSAWDQDPDILQPRSDIKIIPINSVSTPTRRSRNVLDSPSPSSRPSSRPSTRHHTERHSIQFDHRASKIHDSAWTSKSLRRPVTRTSLRSSHHGVSGHTGLVDPLLTKQKSLPDVSGISLFAYSMGRAGFIKPPDVTDQLAVSRSKELKKNRFGVGIVPKLRT
ncbi:hypothetical protein ACHWQZ_G012930 [Mnemiopsis leidyi]